MTQYTPSEVEKWSYPDLDAVAEFQILPDAAKHKAYRA